MLICNMYVNMQNNNVNMRGNYVNMRIRHITCQHKNKLHVEIIYVSCGAEVNSIYLTVFFFLFFWGFFFGFIL